MTEIKKEFPNPIPYPEGCRKPKIMLTENQRRVCYQKNQMPIECLPPAVIEAFHLKVGGTAPFSGCEIISLEAKGMTIEEFTGETW